MKKFYRIAIIMCLMIISVSSYAYASPSKWAQATVNEAIASNLVPEELQNNYQKNITREQFCKLVVKSIEAYSKRPVEDVLNKNGIFSTKYPFKDTKSDEVNAAYKLGIIKGVSEGVFSPTGLLTREQAAVMLKNIIIMFGGLEQGRVINFADRDKIGKWAVDYVNYVTKTNVITGVANGKSLSFQPKSNYTIEQAIATVNRIYNQVDNVDKIDLSLINNCVIDTYNEDEKTLTLTEGDTNRPSDEELANANSNSTEVMPTLTEEERLELEGKYKVDIVEDIENKEFHITIGKSRADISGRFKSLHSAEIDGVHTQKEILLFYSDFKGRNMLKIFSYDGREELVDRLTVRDKNSIGEDIKVDSNGRVYDAFDTDSNNKVYGYQNINLRYALERVITKERNVDYEITDDVIDMRVYENGTVRDLSYSEIEKYGLIKGKKVMILSVDKANSKMTIRTPNGETLIVEI